MWQQLLQLAATTKRNVDGLIASAAVEDVTGTKILDLFQTLQNADATMDALKVTPGLPAYAQTQMDDLALDIVDEFNTMQTALASVITWVADNAGGQLLMPSMDGAGNMTYPSFTAAQTAGLRTELQALSDTIG